MYANCNWLLGYWGPTGVSHAQKDFEKRINKETR